MNLPNIQLPEEVKKANRAVRQKMFGYIAGGLGLVAGLAWNDAIKTLIDTFIPNSHTSVVAKFLYAALITLIIGVVLYYIEKKTTSTE